MLSIPGSCGATCDGTSRRELLRVGGAGLLGMSLPQILQLQAARAANPAPIYAHAGPILGWSGLAAGGVEVHQISGDHDNLILEPHVNELNWAGDVRYIAFLAGVVQHKSAASDLAAHHFALLEQAQGIANRRARRA